MKTHELKLDPKYFEDVKTGKMKFNIRKNDRDFQVGDVLELKLYHKKAGYLHAFTAADANNLETGFSIYYDQVSESKADTIKVKITMINETEEFNMGLDFGDRLKKDFLCTNIKYPNAKPFMASEVRKVLKEYFSTDRLPDGYVILGIEVEKWQ